MATKRVPSMEDAINVFKDVMKRISLQNYVYSNHILKSRNPKGQTVIIIPDMPLWEKLTEDKSFMTDVKEVDMNDPDKDLFNYADGIDSGWIELDSQKVFSGEIIKITIEGFVYDFPINKGMIPLKLKKAEVNNISYRVFTSPYVLGIKKKFVSPVDGGSFTIMRLMQIL